MASSSSMPTCCPALAVSSVTTPSSGAVTVCSIFIASTTASGCPADTGCPAVTRTASTVPGIGDRTTPSARAAAPPSRAATASSSVTIQVRPSRPSHSTRRSCQACAYRRVCPPYLTISVSPSAAACPGTGSPPATETWAPTAARPKTRTSAGGRGAQASRTRTGACPPARHPSGMSHGSVTAPSGSSASEYASAPAASTSSGTPSAVNAARSRSTSPVSSLPATTSG
jgi:hypothetical protein